MNRPKVEATDKGMMRRCIALSKTSGDQGEYPYAAVICRNGEFVCESTNRVTQDRDVTRHAEVVAVSEAQKVLGTTSLDDCTIYVNAEPCAFCCYAIRESRIGKVVYGMRSPVMGGHSRWNILADNGLSDAMPEVFASPPEIVAEYMCDEAKEVLQSWHPLIWNFITARGLFVACPAEDSGPRAQNIPHRRGMLERLMAVFRKTVIDRIGRR
jgi:tRNA(adenine34) deaminase